MPRNTPKKAFEPHKTRTNDRGHASYSHSLNLRAFLLVVLIALLTCIFLVNLIRTNKDADVKAEIVKANIEKVASFDYSNVVDVEALLIKLEEEAEAKRLAELAAKDVDDIPEGINYRSLFSRSPIVGDSLTEGLSAYGWLGEELVYSKIGANISHTDLFENAAYTYPENVFFAFGMNDMLNYGDSIDEFIKDYNKQISLFMSISPDTEVYVNSISAPDSDAIYDKPGLGRYEEYNDAIKKMCKELNVTYIDTTYIVQTRPDLYAGDGIHVSRNYYPIWMDLMIEKAGLA